MEHDPASESSDECACEECARSARVSAAVAAALDEVLPLRGQFAIVVEYAEPDTGAPALWCATSQEGTPWARAGMVAALADYVDSEHYTEDR